MTQEAHQEKIDGAVPRFPRKVTAGVAKKTGRAFRRKSSRPAQMDAKIT